VRQPFPEKIELIRALQRVNKTLGVTGLEFACEGHAERRRIGGHDRDSFPWRSCARWRGRIVLGELSATVLPRGRASVGGRHREAWVRREHGQFAARASL
jgi:hypothetical protein